MNHLSYLDSILNEGILTEVTADEKYVKNYENKLDRAVFDKAVSLDPTTVGPEKIGKYVDWIIRNKATDDAEVTELLQKYDKYKEKIPADKRDINRLKLADLQTLIGDMEEAGELVSKEDRRKKAESEAEVAYEDAKYKILTPLTKEASKRLGAGTDWCTARQEERYNMFDNYNDHGKLYIITNKTTGKRWQLFLDNDGKRNEYKTSENKDFDPYVVFAKQYDLIAWLEEKGFPNSSILTDEQIEDLAEQLVDALDIKEHIDDAIDIAKNVYAAYNDYGAEGGDLYQELSQNDVGERAYHIEEGLNLLQKKYAIDAKNDENKIKVMWDNELDYMVEHNQDPYDADNCKDSGDWIYLYKETVEDMCERMSDERMDVSDLLEYLPKWALYNYENNHKEFMHAKEDLVTEWEDWMGKLDDGEKEEIKNILENAEHVGYGKEGHPSLFDKANELMGD